MTTRGDIIVRASGGTDRLALGTNGQVLTSDGTDAGWADAAGGGLSDQGLATLLSVRSAVNTEDDDFDASTLDAKWYEDTPSSSHDLTTLPGWIKPACTILQALPSYPFYFETMLMMPEMTGTTYHRAAIYISDSQPLSTAGSKSHAISVGQRNSLTNYALYIDYLISGSILVAAVYLAIPPAVDRGFRLHPRLRDERDGLSLRRLLQLREGLAAAEGLESGIQPGLYRPRGGGGLVQLRSALLTAPGATVTMLRSANTPVRFWVAELPL